MKPVTPIGVLPARRRPAPPGAVSGGNAENPIDLNGVGLVVPRMSAHLPTVAVERHNTLQQQLPRLVVLSIPVLVREPPVQAAQAMPPFASVAASDPSAAVIGMVNDAATQVEILLLQDKLDALREVLKRLAIGLKIPSQSMGMPANAIVALSAMAARLPVARAYLMGACHYFHHRVSFDDPWPRALRCDASHGPASLEHVVSGYLKDFGHASTRAAAFQGSVVHLSWIAPRGLAKDRHAQSLRLAVSNVFLALQTAYAALTSDDRRSAFLSDVLTAFVPAYCSPFLSLVMGKSKHIPVWLDVPLRRALAHICACNDRRLLPVGWIHDFDFDIVSGRGSAAQDGMPGAAAAGSKRPPYEVRGDSDTVGPARQRHKTDEDSFLHLPKPARIRQLVWQPEEQPVLSAASMEAARSLVDEHSLESRLARQTIGGFQPLSEELIVLQQHMNALVNRAASQVGIALKQRHMADALWELQALAASLVLPPGQGGVELPVTAAFARDAMLACKPVIRAHLLGACHYFHTHLSPNSRWLRELRYESLIDTHSIRHVIYHGLKALADPKRRVETLAALWVHSSWLAAPWYPPGSEQARQSETLPLALRGMFQALNTRYASLGTPGDQAAFARDLQTATVSAFCSPLLARALASNADVLTPALREPLVSALKVVIAKDDRQLFPSECWLQNSTPILREPPRAQPPLRTLGPTQPTPTLPPPQQVQARQPLLRTGQDMHARPRTQPVQAPQPWPEPPSTHFMVPRRASVAAAQTPPLPPVPRDIGAKFQFLPSNPPRIDDRTMRMVRNEILSQAQLDKPGGLRRMLDQMLVVATEPQTDALTLGAGDRALGVLNHLNETARLCAVGHAMPWRNETAFWDGVVQELSWPEMAPLRKGLWARVDFELAPGHRVPQRVVDLLARPLPVPQPSLPEPAQANVLSPQGGEWPDLNAPLSPSWPASPSQAHTADLALAVALMAEQLSETVSVEEEAPDTSPAQRELLLALASGDMAHITHAAAQPGAFTPHALERAQAMARTSNNTMTYAIADAVLAAAPEGWNANGNAPVEPLGLAATTTATTTTTTTTTDTTTTTTTTTSAATAATSAVPSAARSFPTFLELEDDDTLSPDDLKYREVRGGLVQGPAAGPPVIVKAPQKYDIALESVFPIRDPRYPKEVHRDYRDDNDRTRCHEKVRVLVVRLMPVAVTTPSGVSHVECGQYLASFLGNFKNPLIKEAAELRRKILNAVLGDLRATMKGEPAPSTQWVEVVELDESQCDNALEAQALVGRGGVVPINYAAQDQPSIANGRIVGIFAGARVISDQDHADYEQAMEHRPGSVNHDYGAAIPYRNQRVEYFPYLGGNLGQYLNSTFKLSDRPNQPNQLIVDADNINALFIRVSIDMLTNKGQKKTEPMFVIVQIAPVRKGKQDKLDYGEGYTLTIEPIKVKEEPAHNG